MTATHFSDLLDATGVPVPGAPMGALLSAHAERTPDRVAVHFGGQAWTFAALDAHANRLARHIGGLGVDRGSTVVLSMPNRVEYIAAAFACWKAGATPCLVSHRLTRAEWDATVALTGAACVIGTAATPDDGRLPLVDIATSLPEALSGEPLPPVATKPGKILTSGGSTGRPKLIVDPFESAWTAEKPSPYRPANSVVLCAGPIYHTAPYAYTMVALAEGCEVVLMERFDPLEWLRLVERHRLTTTSMVPTMMSRIAKLASEERLTRDLSSLRFVMHSSAPCPQEIKRWWLERIDPGALFEVYGGTERIGSTLIDGHDWLRKPGSVGRAVRGERVVILDAEGRELPPGEIGEIYFDRPGGPGQRYSYIGAESRVRGNMDSMGDMGWLDEDGYLYLADRRTDMVLVGGTNVWPAEVEAAIESIDAVLCAAVIGLPDEDMGNRLHAIVELAEGVPVPADGLAFLAPAAARLAPFKRPRSVEFTHERVRDDAGKVRRAALRAARIG